jgi:hypothetical protein
VIALSAYLFPFSLFITPFYLSLIAEIPGSLRRPIVAEITSIVKAPEVVGRNPQAILPKTTVI